ncbi:nucleolar and coiled-body phosphoprotein 1 isoform X3 [Lates calcarifer]|uniref:Nucleolar and coiled-body phosphoprotein 1 isoform X3 n=1 Tax=Lates calcarifer TaxID=8187 RepID=A0AAJ7QL11_LATCA|nr:nucleolar and coiled-body phosphoprotein 1 isoform X3 [Lates calcarifer]
MGRCFFLVCFILCDCRVCGQILTYGLQGKTIDLNPGYTATPDDILWKHNGNKVVEFNGNEQHVYGQFRNRVTLGWISAELQISDLRYEDSGTYEVEIYKNNKLHRYPYVLEVIGKVNKPTISCDMNDGSSDGTRATLMCSAKPTHPQSLVKFEWVPPGTVQLGSNLTISLGGELDDKTYTCRVSNPLTNETDTFTAKDCYPEKGAFIVLAVILPIVILVLLLFGLVFCKLKNKACFAERNRDVEKQLRPATEDKETAQDEVHRALLDRAPTLPSQQRLGHLPQSHGSINHKVDKGEGHDMEGQDERPQKGNVQKIRKHFEDSLSPPMKEPLKANKDKKAVLPPSLLGTKPSFCQDSLPSNDKGDPDADQLREPSENNVPESDCSLSEKANEPDPPDVSDTQSDEEPAAAPEQPESDREADENEEEKSPAANVISPPTPKPRSWLPSKSADKAEDTAGEHEEDANSDQVHEETDLPGSEKRNGSDDSSGEKESPTVPEQNSSEMALHEQESSFSQEETHATKDEQPEKDETASEDKSKPEGIKKADSEIEEPDTEQSLQIRSAASEPHTNKTRRH